MLSQPPAKFVESKARFCDRHNAESYHQGSMNTIYLSKPYKDLCDKYKKNELLDTFTMKDLFDKFYPQLFGWVGGKKFREALSLMTCFGIITKKIIPTKKSFKYVFLIKKQNICPHLIKTDKKKIVCGFDWKNHGEIRDFKNDNIMR